MTTSQTPTLTEAAARIVDGTLSATALVEHLLDRIDAVDSRLHSFVHVAADGALKQAAAADRARREGRMLGPLHGIPIAVKDIFDTSDMPTTAHSKRLLGNCPAADAAAVERLRNAGAIVIGKLATHEFAFWGPCEDLPFPPARNPWNTDRYTGGSSAGGGAAVAAGLCLGAVGSDTGGSIRTPAAHCGVSGFKPTFDLVSRRGMFPLSPSLDHAGPMAWTVADCAALLRVMAEPDPGSAPYKTPELSAAHSGEIGGLRVGVPGESFTVDLHPSIAAALQSMLETLRGLGAEIVPLRLPPLQDYHGSGIAILLAEAYAVHREGLRSRFAEYGCHVRDQLPLGALITAADYLAAQRRRRELCAEMASAFEKVDVIVTAAHAAPAPRFSDIDKFGFTYAAFRTMPFNLTGGPALALCIGFDGDGLPLSAQIAGTPFDDARILHVGEAYERVTPWRKRRPLG